MSTSNSVGRLTAALKKDRSGLCAFNFADGRQCRTPRRSGHLHLCYFHAQKEAESLAAKQAGKDISTFFSMHQVSACDLSAALGRVFSAVAEGDLKPKAATALAISVRPSTNPSSSPGTKTPTSLSAIPGAEE